MALLGGILAVLLGAVGSLRKGPLPEVDIRLDRPGIGPRTTLQVVAREPSRGLSGIRVELVQGERGEVLLDKQHEPLSPLRFWGPRKTQDEMELVLGSGSQTWLKEGEATIRVTADRAPAWVSRPGPRVVEKVVSVRLRPPRVEILSTQVNVAQGGAEAVVYRVGPSAIRDGVQVGEWFFPGFPLPGGESSERFSLFAVPHTHSEADSVVVVAEDDLGNRARRQFLQSLRHVAWRSEDVEVGTAFLERVVPAIAAEEPEVAFDGDLLAGFLAINRDLRKKNRALLKELASASRRERLWDEAFMPLPNAAVTAPFGVHRSYRYQGEVVDEQDHLGIDLASVRGAPVPAAARGSVVWAGFLGIYGNAVILDHGYGLLTLYAHLSSIEVDVGEESPRGHIVGRTGATGLAGGDHLHFGVVIQGLPVTPLEWWDGKWIRDHLEAKLWPSDGGRN
jgi:murein DD-endopeptidase MepM/ murein hydrolase activator NlpD